MKKLIFLIFFAQLILISCNNGPTVDSIVNEFEEFDFSKFENISISLRSTGLNQESVFLFAINDKNCRPYLVNYSYLKNEIVSIDDRLIKKSKDIENCELPSKEIEVLFENLIDSKLNFLVYDSTGVFIRHKDLIGYELAKLRIFDKDTYRLKGKTFDRFKENWYLSNTSSN